MPTYLNSEVFLSDQSLPDPREADTQYVPFPPIEKWLMTGVDSRRWASYSQRLQEVADAEPAVLERAYEIVRRVAAIETGAIEGLYEVDRGFTLNVASQAAMWQAALSTKSEDARALIESQLNAYEYVLDFATGREPIALAWVRELHAQVCAGQKTYLVQTEAGPQRHPLPLGEYKSLPNNVVTADGSIHAYCPVDLVGAEMQRFSREIHKNAFADAHPSQQASYVHYCLVAIHPFADGNGRVARALASAFTYRAVRVPFLVFAEDKREYFAALAAADSGQYQHFVDFSVDRCLSAMQLVYQSLRTAQVEEPAEILRGLDDLYLTKGGFTYQEVDAAARSLMKELLKELQDQLGPLAKLTNLAEAQATKTHSNYEPISDRYRVYMNKRGEAVIVVVTAKEPVRTSVRRELRIEIPKDCGERDDFAVRVGDGPEVLLTRMRELHPTPHASFLIGMKVFCRGVLAEIAEELVTNAAAVRRDDL